MTGPEVRAYIEAQRKLSRELAAETAIPEQVITDRLSEDGFWFV